MRCLTKIEMQAFVDDVTGNALRTMINDHLKECEKCARLYDEVVADKHMALDALDILVKFTNQEPIPPFRYPEAKKRGRILPVVAVIMAAASLLLAVLLVKPVVDKNRESNDLSNSEMIMMEYFDGMDLNKMWQEGSNPLIIKDEEGNVILID